MSTTVHPETIITLTTITAAVTPLLKEATFRTTDPMFWPADPEGVEKQEKLLTWVHRWARIDWRPSQGQCAARAYNFWRALADAAVCAILMALHKDLPFPDPQKNAKEQKRVPTKDDGDVYTILVVYADFCNTVLKDWGKNTPSQVRWPSPGCIGLFEGGYNRRLRQMDDVEGKINGKLREKYE